MVNEKQTIHIYIYIYRVYIYIIILYIHNYNIYIYDYIYIYISSWNKIPGVPLNTIKHILKYYKYPIEIPMKLSPWYHHFQITSVTGPRYHLDEPNRYNGDIAVPLGMASWRRVQDRTWLKHGWNMVETWLKHGWNMVETWLKPILRMSGVRDVFSSREKLAKKKQKLIPASSKVGVISAFCPINLHKNDFFGQTRVSSDILLPSPFFSGKIARPNGENTRPRGLTISHSGIYFSGTAFFRKNGNNSSVFEQVSMECTCVAGHFRREF